MVLPDKSDSYLENLLAIPWWSRVDNKKVKERRRLIFLGLHRKPIKPLTQGLLCSRRPQAPSRWGEGTECLLEGILEAQTGKWTQRASVLQRNSLRQRERKRKTERQQDTGTKALMEQRCFIQHCVGFILSYKIAIFNRDKIKTYKLSRKHEIIHMKERGL